MAVEPCATAVTGETNLFININVQKSGLFVLQTEQVWPALPGGCETIRLKSMPRRQGAGSGCTCLYRDAPAPGAEASKGLDSPLAARLPLTPG